MHNEDTYLRLEGPQMVPNSTLSASNNTPAPVIQEKPNTNTHVATPKPSIHQSAEEVEAIVQSLMEGGDDMDEEEVDAIFAKILSGY